MTDEPVLYKRHAKPCKLRAESETACNCPWRAKYKTHDVDLSEWGGEPLDPRKKRPARYALSKLWMADHQGFSPLGYEHSLSVDELLERPRKAFNLDPSQKQAFIRYAAEHLMKAQALLDTLEGYFDYDDRARLSHYRKPLKATRSILRLDRGEGFTFEQVCEILPREPWRALRRQLADLVSDGLLMPTSADGWGATETGRSLQTVSRSSLRRETADKMVEELMVRVRQINASDAYAYRVTDVVLFGSYLGDEPMIGDLDVAVRLTRRFEDVQRQQACEKAARASAPALRNMVADLTWPQEQVERVLRGRHRIDIRDFFELEALIEEHAKNQKRMRTRTIHGNWRASKTRF